MAKGKKPKLPDGVKIKPWDGKDIEVAKLADKKISIARVALLDKNNVPFFGYMSLLLQLRPTDETMTMGTDGEYLYYNPYFVVNNLDKQQLMGTILHEVLHCALLHLWRRNKRNVEKWNIACDLATNPIVREAGMQLPDGALFDYQYGDMSAEQIYKQIPTVKIDISSDWFSDKSKWGKKYGKSQAQNGSKNDSKGSKSKKGKSGKQQGTKAGKRDASDVWRGKNKEVLKKLKKSGHRDLEDYWKGVFESAIRGRTQGDLKGYLKRLYKELAPKQDWRKLLQNYLSASADDFTFASPDRRFLEDEFFIPNLEDTENIEDVVVAVDTSGSISTWQFNHFISEVKQILSEFPRFRGWFIDCDAEVNQVLEIEPGKEFKPKMMGGGGTDFNPVFRKVKHKDWNPRVLVYLTDGYGDFPSKAPDYPVLWLIDSDIEPPFGVKVQYEYDEGDEFNV